MFRFGLGDGSATIADLAAGAATDDEIIVDVAAISTFVELQALMTQVGSDTLIYFGNCDSTHWKGSR